MRQISLLFWLILCVLKVMAELSSLTSCRPPNFNHDMALKNGAFHREKIENDLLCYDLCWSLSDCTDGSYSEETQLCTLSRGGPATSLRTRLQKGSVYFKADTPVCKPFEDPCEVRPCKAGSRCDVLWEEDGKFECKANGCPTPPGFLDDEDQATTSNGSVISFTCPSGESKSVVCKPHGLEDQFKCEEKQALYMFEGRKVMMFDLKTRKQSFLGQVHGLRRSYDVAAPGTVPNVVMVTTGHELCSVDVQTLSLKILVFGRRIISMDCDKDTCVYEMNDQLQLINLKTLTKLRLKSKRKRRENIALDLDTKVVYELVQGTIRSVTFSGKEALVQKAKGVHLHRQYLVLDRKNQKLYHGAELTVTEIDLTTLSIGWLMKTLTDYISGMVLFEGSIIFLSKARLLGKLDLKTKRTSIVSELQDHTSALAVVARQSVAAG